MPSQGKSERVGNEREVERGRWWGEKKCNEERKEERERGSSTGEVKSLSSSGLTFTTFFFFFSLSRSSDSCNYRSLTLFSHLIFSLPLTLFLFLSFFLSFGPKDHLREFQDCNPGSKCLTLFPPSSQSKTFWERERDSSRSRWLDSTLDESTWRKSLSVGLPIFLISLISFHLCFSYLRKKFSLHVQFKGCTSSSRFDLHWK